MFYPYEDNEINYKDCVYGTVIGCCKNGIYIRLENGDAAYAPFGYLQKGTRVLCTLFRKAEKNKNAYVCIDTVFYDSELAA